MKKPTNPGALMGINKIAEQLGVSKQRASQIADHDTFPAPYDDLGPSRGRVWLTSVVQPHLDRMRETRALDSVKARV